MTFFPPPRPKNRDLTTLATPAADPRALFVSEAEAIVRGCHPGMDVRPLADTFALEISGPEGKHTFFLENVFQETREMSPEQRRDRVAFVARAGVPKPTPSRWEEVAPRLVPVLRASSAFGSLPDAGRVQAAAFVRRSVLPFLSACLALDDERSMSFVRADQLQTWGVSESAAFAQATANLAGHDAKHGVVPYDRDAAYPIWQVSAGDSYESSRVLLPGWLAAFAGKVRGRPLLIVPERGQTIIAGDGDAAATERLLVTAEREYAATPRRISPAVYTVDTVDAAGAVVPYVAPAGSALHARTKIAHYKLAIAEYGAQKTALDGQQAAGVVVAKFFAADGGRNGEPLSYTTWEPGKAVSLLPVADYVALPRAGGGDPLWVPWSALREQASAWVRDEPGLDPPRARTTGWPDRAVMARLERAAVVP